LPCRTGGANPNSQFGKKTPRQSTGEIMKIEKSAKITAAFIAVLCAQTCVYSQTYNLEETLPAFGPNILDEGYAPLDLNWGAGTVSDTVVINPTALTIQQSGTISIPAAIPNLSFVESKTVITSSNINNFPNPPTTVYFTNSITGNLTVSLNESGTTVAFNTGPEALTWNGSAYTYNEERIELSPPVEISYSLETGGQTYSGSQDLNSPYFVTLGNQIDLSEYPGAIALAPGPNGNAIEGEYPGIVTLADFTAADGLQTDIVEVVPESSSAVILAAGFGIFCVLRKRFRI
jgi:hypothetical protein